jgi:hypothetical protein
MHWERAEGTSGQRRKKDPRGRGRAVVERRGKKKSEERAM